MEIDDFPPLPTEKKERQLEQDSNSGKPSNGSSKPQPSSDSEVSKQGNEAVGLPVLAWKCKVRGIFPQNSDFKLQSE